jgi:hypothetical protein
LLHRNLHANQSLTVRAHAQMFASAPPGVESEAIELAHVCLFVLAQAGSLVWTLWIVGKLTFVSFLKLSSLAAMQPHRDLLIFLQSVQCFLGEWSDEAQGMVRD